MIFTRKDNLQLLFKSRYISVDKERYDFSLNFSVKLRKWNSSMR